MENARVPISIADFQGVKSAAEAAVDVPQNVVDLIVDLARTSRTSASPVYVSDRRLVKSIALLRVAAYTNGRSAVSEFDCLLLANVLWQRPSESNVIRDWILERLAQDRGVDQVQYLLAGLFGRACRADGDPAECAELREEAARLREVLTTQMRSLAGATSGSLPALRDHLWLSPPDAERAAQTLGPLFSKVRRGLEKLLRECVTLEVALERNTEPHIMALLLPDYWADFIRSGPIEDVKPLGVGGAVSDAVTFSSRSASGRMRDGRRARARAFLRRFYSTLGITKLRHARLGVRPLASRPRRLSNRPAMFPATNNAARSALSHVSALTRASAPRHRFVIPAACSGSPPWSTRPRAPASRGACTTRATRARTCTSARRRVKALQQLVKKARAQARGARTRRRRRRVEELKRILGDSIPDDTLRKLVEWKHHHE